MPYLGTSALQTLILQKRTNLSQKSINARRKRANRDNESKDTREKRLTDRHQDKKAMNSQ